MASIFTYLFSFTRIAKLKEARLAAETEIALFRKEQEEKFQQTIKEVMRSINAHLTDLFERDSAPLRKNQTSAQ